MATSGIVSLNPDHMRNFDAACLVLKALNDAKPRPWERRRGCRTGMYMPSECRGPDLRLRSGIVHVKLTGSIRLETIAASMALGELEL
jgi:hypothetical protein